MDYITTRQDPADYHELDELPETPLYRLYRELKYWRDDLLSCERALTDEDHRAHHEDFRRRIIEARREIAKLETAIRLADLKEETRSLHKTWRLHMDGIEQINERQSVIDREIRKLEVTR